jgi:hypothetical protein
VGASSLNTYASPSVVVKLALVDDVDAKAEGSGDFVEEPGVGEEPLSAGALADRAAVVGGIQKSVENCLGGCRRVSIGLVDPEQDWFFGKRGRPGLAAEPHDDVTVAAAHFEQRAARGLVVGVPDVVRQGVDVDADLVAGLGLLSLLAGPLYFFVQAGGIIGTRSSSSRFA